jgi:hypothetical protein
MQSSSEDLAYLKTDYFKGVEILLSAMAAGFSIKKEDKFWMIYDGETQIAKCSLPLIIKNRFSEEDLKNISHTPPQTLIILAQAGSASLGYAENGELIHHKVIKKYMIRKSQGKSQLSHLKTKGKSRLGSRIRLQQTDQFFNEIHEKIEEWGVVNHAEVILYNCPVRLWSFLFDEADKPSFDPKDARLVKIPLDLDTPGHDTLKYVVKYAHAMVFHIHKQFLSTEIFK